MSHRKRLSKDQKRKKKLKARQHTEAVQPYEGRKYQEDKYVPLSLATEKGILEAYVLSGRSLKDRDVIHALEDLVLELRDQSSPTLPTKEEAQPDGTSIVARIKDSWERHFAGYPWPPSEVLIGILRTILHSVVLRRSHGGYLTFLEEFMADLGIGVQEVSPEELMDLIDSRRQDGY